MASLTPEKRYRIYLACLAFLGTILVLLSTSKYGAGVSSDAVRALSTAEGLLEGRGFFDFVGAPYVHWPPLFPAVLAGLSRLAGLDLFQVGWYLNVLLFPINIWLWGELFFQIFREKPFYAYFGGLAGVLSSSMIRIYANVASDPLFITFMLIFFLAAGRYLKWPRCGASRCRTGWSPCSSVTWASCCSAWRDWPCWSGNLRGLSGTIDRGAGFCLRRVVVLPQLSGYQTIFGCSYDQMRPRKHEPVADQDPALALPYAGQPRRSAGTILLPVILCWLV
jgi:hypothetical protein